MITQVSVVHSLTQSRTKDEHLSTFVFFPSHCCHHCNGKPIDLWHWMPKLHLIGDRAFCGVGRYRNKKHHFFWKCLLVGYPIPTGKLRNFLRLFMGHPRPFYGFSTATGKNTGSLRPKTRFWDSGTKMPLHRIGGTLSLASSIPVLYLQQRKRPGRKFNFP